jgi:ring-1,2-phenylacetyl-CoA epoxidase subunit PaaC
VNPEQRADLADALLALGDDEMILAHRDSEWTGHAPILEEDIAFANIALDEMGHAGLWYRLVTALRDEDSERYPDRLVFRRTAEAFRNTRMVEQPKGDWAFTIVRQYLFDAAEQVRLRALADHPHGSLAQTAAKILNEERYHLRHQQAWVTRLAQGTEESRRRTQAALDALWPLAAQLFQPLPGEPALVDAGLWPSSTILGEQWRSEAAGFLKECGLTVSLMLPPDEQGRQIHSEFLEPLLAEMQSVARLEPEGEW